MCGISNDERSVEQLKTALAASEARYAALVKALPDVIVRTGTDGIIREVRSAVPNYLGVPADEVVGRHIAECTDLDFAGAWLENINRVASTGRADVWNFHTEPPGGPRRYFEARVAAAGAEESVTVFRDITETVVQRQSIEESEQRFRSVFEHSASAALLSDLDGRIVAANPAAIAVGRYTESELLSLKLEQLIPAEDVAEFREALAQVAAGKSLDYEARTIAKDGEMLYWKANASPIIVRGKVVGIFTSGADITEHKRAIQDLKASEERYRLVQSATRDVICEWDYAERTLLSSPNMAAVFGYPAGLRADGFDWWVERVHPDDLTNSGKAFNDARDRGETTYRAEYRFRRGDGEWADVLEIGVFILNEHGKPARVVASLSDITREKAAIAALAASEERFRMVERATDNVIWEWRVQDDSAVFSDNLQTVLGYPGGPMSNAFRWWRSRVHPDDFDAVARRELDAFERGESVYRVEYGFRRADGSFAHIVDTGYLVTDADGSLLKVVGSFQDVTAQRIAQRERDQQSRLLETVLDQMPVGVLIVEAPSGRAIARNRTLSETTGPGHDYEGWQDFWKAGGRRLDGTPLSPEEYPLARALLTGKPIPGEEFLLPADGTAFRRVRVAATPVSDGDGNAIAAVAVLTDVTEQAAREAWLGALSAASRVLESSHDDAHLAEQLARVAVPAVADYCNIREVEPDGTTSLLLSTHNYPDKASLTEEISRMMGLGAPVPGPARQVMETGEPLLIEDAAEGPEVDDTPPDVADLLRRTGMTSAIIVPLRAHEQRLGTVTFVMADSRRRYTKTDVPFAQRLAERMGLSIRNSRLYRELQVSNRAKDSFLATLGHELRNPLAGIRNSLELLQLRLPPEPGTSRTLVALDRQARVMTRLVDDLLDVSRIACGKMDLRREMVDLRRAVQEALDSVRPLLNSREHVVETLLPQDPLWLDGDPMRLAQVFGNLLQNAAKYTPDHGRISIAARQLDEEAVVTIEDTGVGLAPDLLPNVFELFVQGSETAGKTMGGLGIGLPLARQLVQLHGGTITAESEGVGRGCRFIVRLPLAREYPVEGSGPHKVAERPAAVRVLIVDDNSDAADSLRGVLQEWGCEARTAADGRTALEIALQPDQPDWDLVLLDIGLPDLSGFEVARRLRADGYHGTIIAVTGYGEDSDRAAAADAGIDHLLVKPVDFAVLESALTRAVSPPGRHVTER